MTHVAGEPPPLKLGFVGSVQEWRQLQPLSGEFASAQFVAIVLDDPPHVPADYSPTTPHQSGLASARLLRDFDELLSEPAIQAVVVGGALADRPARLRRLVQQGLNCLALHPLDSRPFAYHELALVAEDSRAILMPWFPLRHHPAWRGFLTACRSPAVAPLRHLSLERTGPLATGTLLISRDYAEAADLACSLIGDISELNATGQPSAGRLVVQHRSVNGVDCEIRLAESNQADGWRIQVEGVSGSIELCIDHRTGEASIRPADSSIIQPSEFGPTNVVATIVAEFARAVAGAVHFPTWSDAVRAAELADCCRYSLERRRAVDVYQEKRNELAIFKGRMTSLGCGLIWLTLFLLIMVAAGKGLNLPGMDWLALFTALIWLAFLAIQTLRWILPGDRESKS